MKDLPKVNPNCLEPAWNTCSNHYDGSIVKYKTIHCPLCKALKKISDEGWRREATREEILRLI
jgi:hypothetical protein